MIIHFNWCFRPIRYCKSQFPVYTTNLPIKSKFQWQMPLFICSAKVLYLLRVVVQWNGPFFLYPFCHCCAEKKRTIENKLWASDSGFASCLSLYAISRGFFGSGFAQKFPNCIYSHSNSSLIYFRSNILHTTTKYIEQKRIHKTLIGVLIWRGVEVLLRFKP